MSDRTPAAPRAGLPAPNTVLGETWLRPPRPADVTRASAPPAYRIVHTNQVDAYDQPLTEGELADLGMARFTGDDFRGTARKAAKLSLASAAPEVFTDLADLIATLPGEATMIQHEPPIGTDASSGRVAEENRNVRVRVFLYAASREADNDYHLIIGRDPSQAPTYMTMEVSGLPPADTPVFATLQAARAAYTGFFGNQLPGASYDFYDPPIPVDVTGSVFFDMTHATAPGSRPGPPALRPHMPVIWEIHPISAIVLEP